MNLSQQTLLNKKENECNWYIDQRLNIVQDCGYSKFNIINPGKQSGSIIIIPKDTILYHATVSFAKPGKKHWFETMCPENKDKNYVWFTTSLNHVNYHNYTHILQYTLKEPLRLKFIQNINILGNDFVVNFKEKDIDGYISCNECELAITNKAIQNTFKRFVGAYECEYKIKSDKSKFID